MKYTYAMILALTLAACGGGGAAKDEDHVAVNAVIQPQAQPAK